MTHSCPTRRSSDLAAVAAGEDDGLGAEQSRGRDGRPAGHPLVRVRADADHYARRTSLDGLVGRLERRSEEHTSELQSLMRISYAVFCLKKKNLLPLYNSYNYSYFLTSSSYN